MEKTLVILKPGAVQRALVGEVTARFERQTFLSTYQELHDGFSSGLLLL